MFFFLAETSYVNRWVDDNFCLLEKQLDTSSSAIQGIDGTEISVVHSNVYM